MNDELQARKSITIEYNAQALAIDDLGVPRIILKQWEAPVPGERYAVGADVAEGLEHGDDSAMCVIREKTGMQVFEFVGDIDPDEYGILLHLTGLYYNTAYVLVENNKDITPIEILRTLEYPNLHYEWYLRGEPVDERKQKIGWNTNAVTRNKLINDARKGLREGHYGIRSGVVLDQMSVFQRNKRGRYEAIRGAKDDAIFGWMMAVQGVRFLPVVDDMVARGVLEAPAGMRADHIGDPDMMEFGSALEAEDGDLLSKVLSQRKEQLRETTMGGLV